MAETGRTVRHQTGQADGAGKYRFYDIRKWDKALLKYARKFDGFAAEQFTWMPTIAAAASSIPEQLKEAIGLAKRNIEKPTFATGADPESGDSPVWFAGVRHGPSRKWGSTSWEELHRSSPPS